MGNNVISDFEIPNELARNLSDLLTTQSVRQNIASTLVGTDKYDMAEKKLIEVTKEVDALKNKITNEYVPKEFRDEAYVWNYNGYDIAKNKIDILIAQ
jgi:hypothetical protein